jgi:hypothetical protein
MRKSEAPAKQPEEHSMHMPVTKKSIPRRPQGLKARPQMSMTAEEFAAACERIGLSIKEISERMSLNRATVHAYMTGRLAVTTVVALAMVTLEAEVEKEREANRKRLKRYGYSDVETDSMMELLPMGLGRAIPRDMKHRDDGDAE